MTRKNLIIIILNLKSHLNQFSPIPSFFDLDIFFFFEKLDPDYYAIISRQ